MTAVERRLILPPNIRDPRAATATLGWTAPDLPQVEHWDAEQAWRLGVLANVVAYRCVQLRANACSSIPLVAGTRLGDHTTIRPNAPIARLLGPPPGGPAPKLSATRLIRWTVAQEIVTGRRAWEIETDNQRPDGRPVAFWPLVSAQVRATPAHKGTEWFRLFEYGPAHDPVSLVPGFVFYGWTPSGLNFRQAESPLQSSRFDLSLVQLCDRYGIGFLRNGAVPAAIITTTAFPDDDHRQRFLAAWQAEFGGPENAGRVALNEVGDDGDGPVGDSIDVKVLGLSAKDARLVEARKEAMLEVAMSLGVPWSKLDASGRTFDNAEVEDRAFYEETILPDLVDLQDDINMQLAPRLGDEVVWFDLRGVRALQRRMFTIGGGDLPALLDRGVLLPNEVRGDLSLKPVEWGDRPLQPATSVPDATLPDNTPAPKPEPEPELEPAPEPRALPAAPEHRGIDPEQVEARRARIWRATDAAAQTVETRWERAWRRFFDRQRDATLTRLRGKRGRQALGYGTDGLPVGAETRAPGDPIEPENIFSPDFWFVETNEMAVGLFEAAAGAGLDRLVALFEVAFDVHAAWVEDFIQVRAAQLAGQVTQTTYDQLRDELSDGVGLGESIDELSDRVINVFSQASEHRARTIARTEVISAYNGAAVLGASQLPRDVVAGQEWIATRDTRTRDAHASADGQIVTAGAPFVVAGYSAAYPGDPALPASQTVNCRCAVAFLTPEEMAEMVGRVPARVPDRAARALLSLVIPGEFDELGFRRAAQEVAA
ncbi:MAG: phage portal protein [Actinomycetota bacterium]|nr:MAG: phage portal protein [Actinomycetota bacterium]